MWLSQQRHTMLEWLKPYGRAIKFRRQQRWAERIVAQAGPADLHAPLPSIAFFIGCGRSGTTILGHIFSRHPQVCYLSEPHHLWAAIDPRCDVINFYRCIDPYMLMDARYTTPQARQRFNRLMHVSWQPTGAELLIEKTPYNAMRIGYLETLAPEAKFVHIVRDGVDVARSIARLASSNTYRIAGLPRLNQWWGVEYSKWKVLMRDGAAAGYFPDEVADLTDEIAKGVYEWLVSLAEVERWRRTLGNRIHELTYPALVLQPESTLRALCSFLGIDAPANWLQQACSLLEEPHHTPDEPIGLPWRIADAVNHWQARFGFEHQAVALP